ncbi:phage head morphogenesis protein [Ancylobacter defluvii]|uniref:Phage head morphogenesis domain-containing protein n=1 Tax=Ancylobacter defluvii TaxID=1282440 RepID=A0A9W6JYW6_9HYPH|nr:phage minor head protein [Ancylobacter defluvii]MBS7586416.1 hypothetical protein [Ancylobacter defluvii]GLK85697.1 hypothetical protein GCM10017653_37670 [Ancylobacter defluvii]
MTTTVTALDLKFDEAIAYLRQKTNTTSEHWTDVYAAENVRAFTVAGAGTDALVGDFRKAVTKALETGTSLRDFRDDFDAIVDKHGWIHNGTPGWRSRIIFETNLSTAYSAGRYAQQTEPETLAAFPYWEYVHSGSAHPREAHKALNGKIYRADDPWWDTYYPPNGWGCGCRVRPVSARGLARMGIRGPVLPAPTIETRQWVNPHTGEIKYVPVGIDPGFEHNPGRAWKAERVQLPANATLQPSPGAPSPQVPTTPAPAPRQPKQKELDLGPAPVQPAARPARSRPAPAPDPNRPAWPWEAEPRRAAMDISIDTRAMELAKQLGVFKNKTEARRLANELMAGVPPELKVSPKWTAYGERLMLDMRHPEAILQRSFWREGTRLIVEHDYFWLHSRFQGGGNAVRMLRTAFATYDRIGVREVRVHANLDKGGYVWARNGFSPRDPDSMRYDLRRSAQWLDDARRDELLDVVGSSSDLELMYDVSMLRDGNDKWGESLLLGSDWYGYADLLEPRQRELLARALSRGK